MAARRAATGIPFTSVRVAGDQAAPRLTSPLEFWVPLFASLVEHAASMNTGSSIAAVWRTLVDVGRMVITLSSLVTVGNRTRDASPAVRETDRRDVGQAAACPGRLLRRDVVPQLLVIRITRHLTHPRCDISRTRTVVSGTCMNGSAPTSLLRPGEPASYSTRRGWCGACGGTPQRGRRCPTMRYWA